MSQLPLDTQRILSSVPNLAIGQDGNMVTRKRDGSVAPAPLARTDWNKEKTRVRDELIPGIPWAVVLHWYGDHALFDSTIPGYLRGFNQGDADNGIQTSAHYLVGDGNPDRKRDDLGPIGILQLQTSSADGNPYQAGSLNKARVIKGLEHRSYILRAIENLKDLDPRYHSVLLDINQDRNIDPNLRSIAVEITGKDFDSEEGRPSPQKIANVLASLKAIMKRYQIPASSLTGHFELQAGKSDPGKKFLSYIRYLLGIYSLYDDDQIFKRLVFDQYAANHTPLRDAAVKYFDHIYDFLSLIATPKSVYEWEIWSGFWLVRDSVLKGETCRYHNDHFIHPLEGGSTVKGGRFLDPPAHAGVDLYPEFPGPTRVRLMGNGQCVFAGWSRAHPRGPLAVFRHRLPTGGEILSLYGNLQEMHPLQEGAVYPGGTVLGMVDGSERWSHLHFSMAYSTAWPAILGNNAWKSAQENAGWILDHYLDPLSLVGSGFDPGAGPTHPLFPQ